MPITRVRVSPARPSRTPWISGTPPADGCLESDLRACRSGQVQQRRAFGGKQHLVCRHDGNAALERAPHPVARGTNAAHHFDDDIGRSTRTARRDPRSTLRTRGPSSLAFARRRRLKTCVSCSRPPSSGRSTRIRVTDRPTVPKPSSATRIGRSACRPPRPNPDRRRKRRCRSRLLLIFPGSGSSRTLSGGRLKPDTTATALPNDPRAAKKKPADLVGSAGFVSLVLAACLHQLQALVRPTPLSAHARISMRVVRMVVIDVAVGRLVTRRSVYGAMGKSQIPNPKTQIPRLNRKA